MRILLTAAIAASLAAGSLSALAQTAPAPTPVKQKACKKLKDENACTTGRTDCAWSKPGDEKGKCKKAPKPKTT